MITTKALKEKLASGQMRDILLDIYADESMLDYQTKRYIRAVEKYESLFGADEVMVLSAPGRSEVCGNHTDHQHGQILAAAVNLDAIAIARPLENNRVKLVSGPYPKIEFTFDDLKKNPEEEGSTAALIKGVLAGMQERGYKVGGFQTYITSDVLTGAGLSSSAAFETLIGTIVSHLYNDGRLDDVTNAIIGQYAENVFFGKPCGLMDQMACSVGSLVHVDFADPAKPIVEKVDFDMNSYGLSLCITDTKGSHADLTDEYAAVPEEMKKVAAYFGRDVLLGITRSEVLENVADIRKAAGDRAVLRALHFIAENERVSTAVDALKSGDIGTFLDTIKASGDSSYKFLQNVFSVKDVSHQSVSLALCVSEGALGDRGVCRVHGGGFAGTIQAFVKNEAVEDYKKAMEGVFGEGSCHVLKIRKYGGMKVYE